MSDIVEERVCPVCRKKFYLRCDPPVYGWRINDELYCGYTCMRKVEKLLNVPEDNGLRVISADVSAIWKDMRTLRSYSRKYDHLRRMKYSDRLTENAKQDLVILIADCAKRIERIKIKYAYGIGKLSKENYQLIYGFAICGWDKDRLVVESGLSYETLCDRFEEIFRSLKRYENSGIYRRRWICG
ncbi:MAG: hypothetical protein IJS93_03320 [Clostridia bacterium]|nr:hypothetical protein [Clostridia bacterium]